MEDYNFLIAEAGEAAKINEEMLVNSGRNYLCPNHYRVENGWMNNNGFPYQSHGTGYMRGLALNNPTIPPQWFVDFPSLSISLFIFGWNFVGRRSKRLGLELA